MHKRIFTSLALFVSVFLMVGSLCGQTLPPGFSYSYVGSGWVQPVGTAFNATGTKLFVWEKGGKVYVCNWNSSTGQYDKQSTPVLNISPEVGNWRDHGMLGLAVDPNFDVNGLIYVSYVVDRHYLMNFGTGSYNANTNNYYSATIGRVTRYGTTNSGGNLIAVAGTRTVLIGDTKKNGIPVLYESHGVGSLVFASDGTLLVSTGDAASYTGPDHGSRPETYFSQALADTIIRVNENVGAFRSQMLNSLNGKILRIDPVTGNGINSNPFYDASSPTSAQSRLWTLGLRNPFRMCVRPGTGSSNPATGDIGEIYVTEVGLDTYEELHIVKAAAANCGWPTFEGITPMVSYASAVVDNMDEPNPLYGISGCTQQWLRFNNLIRQANATETHTVYNPCNPSMPISSVNDNRFYHSMPAMDWKHYVDSSRVGVFVGNNLTVQQAGSPASGVTGTGALFQGNTAISGCWYLGSLFPPSFYDSYFMADYTQNWIKNIKVQFTDRIQKIDSFEFGFPGVVHMSYNPLDGTVFVADIWSETINRITYGGNQPPVVKMSSNKTYGAGPLVVNFTGNTSFDPDGPSVSYNWNFGDPSSGGSNISTAANPSHTFTPGNSSPKKYVVKLTVKDNLNATSIDSIIISANNTPPAVTITSPVNNSFYQLGPDTSYTLQATVIDAEHHSNELSYVWQTFLRHNTHQHPQPTNTEKLTSEVISRIGCNGDNYYWFIKLTVTDGAGLSKIDSAQILPYCGGPLPVSLLSFAINSHAGTNSLTWVTSDELNLKYFEIERSYDGANFTGIGTVNARMTSGNSNYDFKDDNFLDGYVYYRLKMIDKDGKFSYSYIVRVYSGTAAANDLTISPNPFRNEFLLGAVFSKGGKITLRIIDSKGAVVKTIKTQVNAGFNSFQVDKFESLSQGVYFLEVIQDSVIRKTKLIKEK